MKPRQSCTGPAYRANLLRRFAAIFVLGCAAGLSACGGGESPIRNDPPTPPTITAQPQDQSVMVDATATFSVVASGTAPLSYQWSKNNTVISDATSSSYTTPSTVSGDNGATFTVTVTNSAGSQTSNAATLTVTAAPVAPQITNQPTNETVTAPQTATFSVLATGTAPLSYQWSENGNAIAGATAAIYTTPATTVAQSGSTFAVTVTNAAGNQTSNPVTLTVSAAPVAPQITVQPTNQTVTAPQTATFSVVATGTAPLSYQWSENGNAIAGATAASYTTPATTVAQSGSTFAVTVTNPAGNQTSNPVTLTVSAAPIAPQITVQPTNQTVTAPQTATFSVVATGTAPLSYQWSKNGTVIGGATGASYTTPATTVAQSGSTFTVTVTNTAGNQLSNAATLTVTAAAVAPQITTQPTNQSVTAPQTATFSVLASGTAPLSYQWSQNGSVIPGATAASYTTPATTVAQSGSTFTVTVTNAAGKQTSNPVTLTVSAAPVAPQITVQPSNQSVTAPQTATFSVVATGTAPLTYQWSENGTAIGGATAASYTTPATTVAQSGSTFAVTVTNAAGNQTSNTVTLTVSAAPVAPHITVQPTNQTVTAPQTATFSVVATGTAPLTYQWSQSGSAIPGATGASYTTPATTVAQSGTTFMVTVTNVAGNQTSNTVTLTVNPAPTAPQITIQPSNQIVTAPQTATFSVVATGTAPLTYQWSQSGSAIPGATGATYTTPATTVAQSGTTFTVTVTNVAGNQTSNTVTLTVNPAPTAPQITIQPSNQTVTAPQTATFSVVATGTAPLTYQWSENGSAIPGATAASYTTPATTVAQSGSTFTVTVTNAVGNQTSNTVTLTVNPSGGGSGTPIMFQHISSSTDPLGNGIPGHTFTFHTESLPANTVAVMGVSAPSSLTVTISDTLVGSWSTAVCSANGGNNNNTKAWVFVQSLGGTGGADGITINVGSSDTQPVQFDITLWQNISTSAPANGSLCAGNLQGSAINPGSFTPTTNNDANGGNVIWNYTPICTGYASGNPTKWIPGSGFSLLNGDIIWSDNQGFPEASQYYLQPTQASVTPSITATGDSADCFNSTSVALAVANNGAVAPSTIHVARILHESFIVFQSPGTQVIQTPTVGNLRVMGFTWPGGCLGNSCLGSISSSDGCTWTLIGGGGAGEQAYAENCAPCIACTTSITYTGANTMPAASFRFYDIENAAAGSYQNSTGGDGSCSAPTVTDAPGNFTPTGANSGLTIATIGNGQGPITGLAAGSPAATFDLWTFVDQTDSDIADNADGQAHYYYSSKATQNWNWAKQNANDGCYWWASNYN